MDVGKSIVAATVFLTLCSAAAAQQGTGTRDPNWFNKVLAREAQPMAERVLASDDGAFKTRVAAEALAQPKPSGRGYYVQLNLGTEVPMECWIYPTGHDVAATHRVFSERLFRSIVQNQGPIDLRKIQRLDAGVFDGHLYQALDWLYRVKSRRGSTLSGQIKLLAALKGEASVHCLQNEAGYAKTFERVFRGLVNRLEIAAAASEPYYQEAMTVIMSGQRVGGGQVTFTRDQAGRTRISERNFLLVPADQTTLVANDTYEVQLSSADGRLIKEITSSSNNGEVSTRLVLERAGEEGWKVSGKSRSKDFATMLEPKVLPSALGEMLLMRQFIAGAEAGDRKAYSDWSATDDPSTFTVVQVQVKERTADGVAARLDLGSEVLDAVFDQSGSVKLATLNLGEVELKLQRVHTRGALDARSEPQAPEAAPPAAAAEMKGEEGETQDPSWFDQLLAREAEAMEEHPVTSDDGVFRTRVAAELAQPPELIDGDYYVQLNVGSDTPMECWVYPEGHDMAASHRAFSAAIFANIAENQGEVEKQAIQRIDAGVFGAHPYLALDWLYRIKSPRGPLAGQLKLVAGYNGDSSVHCIHNEAGFGKTFERVFRGFVGRLEIESAAEAPYYQLILLARLHNINLGVVRKTFTRTESGNTKIVEGFSALVPLSTESVAGRDTYNIQMSSPDGRLLTEVDVASENGELTTHLTLEPSDDGAWKVSGTNDSNEYQGSTEPREMFSNLGQQQQLREFLAEAGAGDEKTFWDWSSGDDPSAFSETRFVVQERTADGIAVRLHQGSEQMDAILDAGAAIKSATLTTEGVEMQFERLYIEGSLPAP